MVAPTEHATPGGQRGAKANWKTAAKVMAMTSATKTWQRGSQQRAEMRQAILQKP